VISTVRRVAVPGQVIAKREIEPSATVSRARRLRLAEEHERGGLLAPPQGVLIFRPSTPARDGAMFSRRPYGGDSASFRANRLNSARALA
jgi:hypothetical protein